MIPISGYAILSKRSVDNARPSTFLLKGLRKCEIISNAYFRLLVTLLIEHPFAGYSNQFGDARSRFDKTSICQINWLRLYRNIILSNTLV